MTPQGLRAKLTDAYWVIPAACVAGTGALALLLIEIDEGLDRGGNAIAFAGGPDSARSLLAAIASSMLTLTALVFSITVVVLQLASSQFSPRVLRTFLHDRKNQVTLGVFTATFVYALVALRAVRGEDGVGDRFVPGITISVAFAMVLVSVGLFIAYIHNITQSIRVSNIIDRITTETERAIAQVGGDRSTPRATPPVSRSPAPHVVSAPERGVLTGFDEASLVRRARDAAGWIEIPHPVGAFVPAGAPMAHLHATGEHDVEAIGAAFTLAVERSMDHDPAFGFRQLVDIAERALSPGTNDPSTAVQCLDQLHHLLRRIAETELPTGVLTDDEGSVRVVASTLAWEDYLALSFDEIRLWGGGSLQIHRRLRLILGDLCDVVGPSQLDSVLEQIALLDATAAAELPESERNHLG